MPTGKTASYEVVEYGDNGEFLTWATVELTVDGEVVGREEFTGSSEFPGEDALQQAHSFGSVFVETETTTMEERLGPFGLEWQRERWAEGVPF